MHKGKGWEDVTQAASHEMLPWPGTSPLSHLWLVTRSALVSLASHYIECTMNAIKCVLDEGCEVLQGEQGTWFVVIPLQSKVGLVTVPKAGVFLD